MKKSKRSILHLFKPSFFFLYLVIWWIIDIGSQELKQPCISRITPTLLLCNMFLHVIRLICWYFMKDLLSVFIRDIGLQFSLLLLWCFWQVLASGLCWPHKAGWDIFPSPLFSEKVCVRLVFFPQIFTEI